MNDRIDCDFYLFWRPQSDRSVGRKFSAGARGGLPAIWLPPNRLAYLAQAPATQ